MAPQKGPNLAPFLGSQNAPFLYGPSQGQKFGLIFGANTAPLFLIILAPCPSSTLFFRVSRDMFCLLIQRLVDAEVNFVA